MEIIIHNSVNAPSYELNYLEQNQIGLSDIRLDIEKLFKFNLFNTHYCSTLSGLLYYVLYFPWVDTHGYSD